MKIVSGLLPTHPRQEEQTGGLVSKAGGRNDRHDIENVGCSEQQCGDRDGASEIGMRNTFASSAQHGDPLRYNDEGKKVTTTSMHQLSASTLTGKGEPKSAKTCERKRAKRVVHLRYQVCDEVSDNERSRRELKAVVAAEGQWTARSVPRSYERKDADTPTAANVHRLP